MKLRSYCAITIGASLSTASLAATVSTCLQEELRTLPEDQYIAVNVRLDTQLNVSALTPYLQGLSKTQRRMTVIRAAKDVARRTQEPLLAHLADLKADGAIMDIDLLWASNEIQLLALPSVARGLFDHPGIAHLGFNKIQDVDVLTDAEYGAPSEEGNADLWNLQMIDAPEAWAQGFMGQGVLLANVDTGTDRYHNDYRDRIWENPGETQNGVDDDDNGYVDDLWGWNFDTNDNNPGYSFSTHGTNTAGIMVGDGTNGTATGVAPAGHLMVIRSCTGEFNARKAYQYALIAGADVLSSSCSYKYPDCPDYAAFRHLAEVEAAAGLFHTNSIGNQRGYSSYPVPYNISAPAHGPAAFIHPDQDPAGSAGGVQGCGGVTSNGRLYSGSGEGPAEYESGRPSCGPQYDFDDYPYQPGKGLIKPDYVTPTEVTTTSPNNRYTSNFGGTSAATPHSGGVASLILSAVPDATPAEVSEAMQMTAEDKGTTGKDNDFGAGVLDADDAINYLIRDLTLILDPPAQQVQDGNEITLTASLFNNTSSIQRFTLVVNAYDDAGRPYPGNPVFGPRTIRLQAGASVDRTVSAVVSATPGLYTVEGILKRSNQAVSTDSFLLGVTQ